MTALDKALGRQDSDEEYHDDMVMATGFAMHVLKRDKEMKRIYRKLRIKIRPVVGIGYLGTEVDKLAQGMERTEWKFLFLCFDIRIVRIA